MGMMNDGLSIADAMALAKDGDCTGFGGMVLGFGYFSYFSC